MRLFVALNFPTEIKNKLSDLTRKFGQAAVSGNFTRPDNFHLTLAFLGEQPPSKIALIKKAMEQVEFPSFSLTFSKLSRFQRAGGDIWFLAGEECPVLDSLQKELSDHLRKAGFLLEKRPFRAHLTLGREVVLSQSFDQKSFEREMPSIQTVGGDISLMKSERIAGRLTYTEVFKREAKRS